MDSSKESSREGGDKGHRLHLHLLVQPQSLPLRVTLALPPVNSMDGTVIVNVQKMSPHKHYYHGTFLFASGVRTISAVKR